VDYLLPSLLSTKLAKGRKNQKLRHFFAVGRFLISRTFPRHFGPKFSPIVGFRGVILGLL
jgi:hypothetical protein